jgi:hypothetical protein
MKGFILGLPVMVPCEECSTHATAFIEGNYDRLDDIVSGRMKLFNFFVDFHNKVNKRYKKKEISYEEAYFKDFLVKRSKISNNDFILKKNSSKNFYQFLFFIKDKTV